MKKHSFVHYLTKILIDLMFYAGIVTCIVLPFLMPQALDFFSYSQEVRWLFTVVLLAAGLCAIYILFQLKAIFKTLLVGDPFVYGNVSCLRKCGTASFLIALIFLVRMVFGVTLGAALVVAIFSLLGLFSFTLKDVFKQAVAFKEENDWTV
ncbi:MAG: DUF2975 domain-containing protein [Oscillospiraceae bacterium]|nr:DUF2975 domain-containing protein [Oscillospiraceae bacterium]